MSEKETYYPTQDTSEPISDTSEITVEAPLNRQTGADNTTREQGGATILDLRRLETTKIDDLKRMQESLEPIYNEIRDLLQSSEMPMEISEGIKQIDLQYDFDRTARDDEYKLKDTRELIDIQKKIQPELSNNGLVERLVELLNDNALDKYYALHTELRDIENRIHKLQDQKRGDNQNI